MTMSIELSQDEVLSLVQRYKDGDDSAGWQLVQSQIGVIQKVARKFVSDVDDLASELMIVVFSSLKNFDPSKANLSTFVWTVAMRRSPRLSKKLQAMMRGVNTIEPLGPELDLEQPDNFEQQFADLQEAAEAVGLNDMEVDLLVSLAKGTTKERLSRRFKNAYSDFFRGIPHRMMTRALVAIRQDAIARLREALGIDVAEAAPRKNTEEVSFAQNDDIKQKKAQEDAIKARYDATRSAHSSLQRRGLDVPLAVVSSVMGVGNAELRAAVCYLARSRSDMCASMISNTLRLHGFETTVCQVQKILQRNGLGNKTQRLAAVAAVAENV